MTQEKRACLESAAWRVGAHNEVHKFKEIKKVRSPLARRLVFPRDRPFAARICSTITILSLMVIIPRDTRVVNIYIRAFTSARATPSGAASLRPSVNSFRFAPDVAAFIENKYTTSRRATPRLSLQNRRRRNRALSAGTFRPGDYRPTMVSRERCLCIHSVFQHGYV